MLVRFYRSNLVYLIRLVFAIVGVGFAYIHQVEYANISLLVCTSLKVFSMDIANQFDASEEALSLGLEIETQSDFVAFGLLPVALLLSTSGGQTWGIFILTIYLLAVSLRLAHFNRPEVFQGDAVEIEGYYLGLPLISAGVIVPFVLLLAAFLSQELQAALLGIVLVVLAGFYLVKRPVQQLSKEYLRYGIFVLIGMIVLFLLMAVF